MGGPLAPGSHGRRSTAQAGIPSGIMRLSPVARSALRAVSEHRLRAGLTVLGIAIGASSVLLLVSIAVGVRDDITRQVELLGSNVIFVLPGKLSATGRPEGMSVLGISTLTLRDADAIQRVAGVRAAIPITFVFGSISRNLTESAAMVIAADHRMAGVRAPRIAEGRFYTAAEEGRLVCVLGHEIRQEVFGRGKAVGNDIAVRDKLFRVIGVLAPEEPSAFSQVSFSRVVYIPWRAAVAEFKGAQINRIIVQTDYRADPDRISAQLRRILLRSHGSEDFGLLTYRQLLAAIFHVFSVVTALVVGIAAISLVVAGIGIMNIMLITVTERTREIGVRMAVGARRSDIFRQFLAEAVTLSVLGGFVGVVVAAAAARAIGHFTLLRPVATPAIIGLALGVCIAMGITFGTVPAARASRLSPVEALRYE